MLQPQLLTFLPAIMAGLLAAQPGVARACSCGSSAIYLATPSDGTTDVPIDIAPVIHGQFQDGAITVTREGGDSVAFELRTEAGLGHCGGRIGELTFKAALEPNTRYVLRADGSESLDFARTEIAFTTGSDRVPDAALSTPALRATFLQGNPTGDSCASEVQGCIGIDDDGTQIELTFVRNEGAQRVALLEVDTQITVDFVPDCVEARTRDAAGRRSAPTVLCGKELHAREATEADYQGGELACDDGAIRQTGAPSEAGAPADEAAKAGSNSTCAIDARPASGSFLALLSTLAVAFAARRRRSPPADRA